MFNTSNQRPCNFTFCSNLKWNLKLECRILEIPSFSSWCRISLYAISYYSSTSLFKVKSSRTTHGITEKPFVHINAASKGFDLPRQGMKELSLSYWEIKYHNFKGMLRAQLYLRRKNDLGLFRLQSLLKSKIFSWSTFGLMTACTSGQNTIPNNCRPKTTIPNPRTTFTLIYLSFQALRKVTSVIGLQNIFSTTSLMMVYFKQCQSICKHPARNKERSYKTTKISYWKFWLIG